MKAVDPKRLRDLVKLLDGLCRTHEELLALVRKRIDAMRRADVAAMQALADQEQALVKRIDQREGLRRQLMDKIGEQWGLSARTARALSLSQLTSHATDPERSSLEEAGRRLGNAITKVAQANRVAGAISREVLTHLEWVFASVRPAGGPRFAYTGNAQHLAGSGARILETVG
ncbi:MAG: flagellar protein FlgN [Phycisphaerae bacterium]|jgi:hypothetical protein